MKCQNCNHNEANFHYSSNINGTITETHLCGECARQTGYDQVLGDLDIWSPFSVMGPFSRSFFGPVYSGGWMSPAVSLMPPQTASVPGALEPGRAADGTPLDAGEELKARRHLNELRARLKNAVDAEQYEKAAELRDEIYRLEKQNKED